ncbi:MAG: KpsF/GutQ family sugar-phosphate isomerase [Acidobacteriaceae bacterium]|jgi:arabinose-5-phosphate isomerase
MPTTPQPTSPSDLVRIEARALLSLAIRLDGPMAAPFAAALDLIAATTAANRKLILLGIGKSGLIARKIAATLRSTGTPAHYLHPSEALHGDLGMVAPGDLALALSSSGETEELLALLPALQHLGAPIVSLCGTPASTLAQASLITLDCSVTAEACALNLAPTASTTVMLALGDALALEVSRRRGFQPEHFAQLHPGGRLGRRLARVRDLMHSGDALPAVAPDTPLPAVIHEMSHRKLGMTTVVESAPEPGAPGLESPTNSGAPGLESPTNSGAPGLASETWKVAPQTPQDNPPPRKLLGMISDGDLRRLFERDGHDALDRTAADIMNPHPITIPPEAFAAEALALMESRKITSLIVATPAGEALGVLHLHDLWTPANL